MIARGPSKAGPLVSFPGYTRGPEQVPLSPAVAVGGRDHGIMPGFLGLAER